MLGRSLSFSQNRKLTITAHLHASLRPSQATVAISCQEKHTQKEFFKSVCESVNTVAEEKVTHENVFVTIIHDSKETPLIDEAKPYARLIGFSEAKDFAIHVQKCESGPETPTKRKSWLSFRQRIDSRKSTLSFNPLSPQSPSKGSLSASSPSLSPLKTMLPICPHCKSSESVVWKDENKYSCISCLCRFEVDNAGVVIPGTIISRNQSGSRIQDSRGRAGTVWETIPEPKTTRQKRAEALIRKYGLEKAPSIPPPNPPQQHNSTHSTLLGFTDSGRIGSDDEGMEANGNHVHLLDALISQTGTHIKSGNAHFDRDALDVDSDVSHESDESEDDLEVLVKNIEISGQVKVDADSLGTLETAITRVRGESVVMRQAEFLAMSSRSNLLASRSSIETSARVLDGDSHEQKTKAAEKPVLQDTKEQIQSVKIGEPVIQSPQSFSQEKQAEPVKLQVETSKPETPSIGAQNTEGLRRLK
eukprot:TRINITY_DN5375_c0_g1_i5.p1 TRINITY_DN5375_c0_g1~~TRINITY_DN5375_c0_g1_i5.p1  ORF type:complete len:475 (-),score=111.61 TRINITY_DN5375_c0_g1_i5:32-1456(-)